jgi:hypothetical protein
MIVITSSDLHNIRSAAEILAQVVQGQIGKAIKAATDIMRYAAEFGMMLSFGSGIAKSMASLSTVLGLIRIGLMPKRLHPMLLSLVRMFRPPAKPAN